MIFLTRLDKQQFFINPDHIVSIEETPDTVITLFNGHHFIVMDSARSIIDKIVAFRARIIHRSGALGGGKLRGGRRRELYRDIYRDRQNDGMHTRGGQRGLSLHTRDF